MCMVGPGGLGASLANPLAAYIAMSALRSRSSLVVPCAASATPMLQWTKISCSAISNGFSSAEMDAGVHCVGVLLVSSELLDEDRELVTAEPRDGIRGPDAGVEPYGHLAKEVVSRRVAQRVVHRLEVVEVHEQNRETAPVAMDARDRVAHPVLEQRPVGKAGEGVVEGLVAQPVLKRLAFAHITDREHRPPHRAIVAEVEGIDSTSIQVPSLWRARHRSVCRRRDPRRRSGRPRSHPDRRDG